jgi:ATP-dependent Clp protease protease subunit
MNKDELVIDKSHSESLNDNGIYVFMDDVTDETIKPVIEWLLFENHVSHKRKRELLLMICSNGGDLHSAFALIDVMRSSKIPIKTVGLGLIASCGLLLFMAGSKGRRVLTPNTSILSHQFTWANEGKAHELFSTFREYTLTQLRMLEHYRICTGLSDEEIKEHLLPPQDKWLDANEAMSMGICDIVDDVNTMTTVSAPRTSTRKAI